MIGIVNGPHNPNSPSDPDSSRIELKESQNIANNEPYLVGGVMRKSTEDYFFLSRLYYTSQRELFKCIPRGNWGFEN